MTPAFITDTVKKNQVINVWKMSFGIMFDGATTSIKNDFPTILKKSKNAIDKIRSRGGDVVFIREPSSGDFWKKEQVFFKRNKFWDPLLAATRSKGVYFTDYPSISHFKCVEWSHLSQPDAMIFTAELIKLLPSSFVK